MALGPAQRLAPSAITLAKILRGRGFDTAGVVAGSLVFSPFGIGAGFDEYRDHWDNLRALDDSAVFPWLRRRRGRPFFLYVHPIDVHDPYGIVAGDKRPYPKTWDRPYRGSIDGRVETLAKINGGELKASASDLAHLVDLYDDGISFLDAELGRLVDELRAEKALDKTLFILTADHGDGFLEHGLVEHANSPYEELLHVPLIMRFPAGGPARAVDGLASLVDVMPTVLAFLGIPAPARIQGASLLPLIGGPADRGRIVFSDVLVPSQKRRASASVARSARSTRSRA